MAKITKLTDEQFNGRHPNGINPGYEKRIETTPVKPVVGMPYSFGSLFTSRITEIIEMNANEYVFRTKNSIYKVEVYK
jgi:hypothetical protein